MKRKVFKANVWIKFERDGLTIIGRAMRTDAGDEIVRVLDSLGNVSDILWSEVEKYGENLTQFKFQPTLINSIEDVKNECPKETQNELTWSLRMYSLFNSGKHRRA